MDTEDEFPIDLNLYPSDTQPPSSSGPFLFGHWLPPPPPPPLSPSSPLILPDTQLSCPFPFLYDSELPSPLSPSPMLLPDTPSSRPFLFSSLVPPPPPLLLPDTPSSRPFIFSASARPPLSPSSLLLPDTPSSGSFIFSASVPRRNEEEEWRSNQAMWNAEEERWSYLSNLQASQRQETRRNAEEERWSSIQRQESWRNEEEHSSQVPLLEQSTLTERQIWEALDKLKNQVYTGEACVICLEYFVPKEEVSVTPCNHIFHKKCLVPWVMQKGQCPHCRFVLFEATRNQW